MKIERDGNFYELTSEELVHAYWEQEHLYDVEDVKCELESIVSADVGREEYVAAAKRVLETPELLHATARDKRHNMDKHGMSWEYATAEAVKDSCCREQAREELNRDTKE